MPLSLYDGRAPLLYLFRRIPTRRDRDDLVLYSALQSVARIW